MHTLNLNARYAPDPKELLALLDLFDSVEKPFLMHCKSGADRAGLASALYLIHSEGKSVAEAQTMLSFKYLHVNDRKTGIMGHTLRAYGSSAGANGCFFARLASASRMIKKLSKPPLMPSAETSAKRHLLS